MPACAWIAPCWRLPDKTRGQETLDLCKEIDRIEHEVDTLRKRAIKAMFEQEGDDAAAWRAIKLRELYSLARNRDGSLQTRRRHDRRDPDRKRLIAVLEGRAAPQAGCSAIPLS